MAILFFLADFQAFSYKDDMNRLIDFITEQYHFVFVVTLVFTLPFLYCYTRQDFFNSIDAYFEKNHPDILYYKHFQQIFGNEEVAVVIFRDHSIFTPKNIDRVRNITHAVQNLSGVQAVLSLTEAEVAAGDGNTVDFRKIVPEGEVTQASVDHAKQMVDSHEFLRNNLVSEDDTTTAIIIELAPTISNERKTEVLETIKDRVEAIAGGQVALHYSGGPFVEVEITRLTGKDNRLFTPLAFLVIFVFCLVLLKKPGLAILGQITILLTGLWGVGFLVMWGETINTVTVIIGPVLLAIAIADSIHILSCYRKTLYRNGGRHKDAVITTIRNLWRPCLFTSLTTAAGYFSFMTTDVRPVRIVGFFTGIGILNAFLITIIVLPAMMMVFRRYCEPADGDTVSPGPGIIERMLQGTVRRVQNHYRGIVVVFTGLTLIGVYGIGKLTFETDFTGYLKESNQVRQDIGVVETNIRGTVPVELVISAVSDTIDFTQPDSLKLLDRIQAEALAGMDDWFTSGFSAGDYFKQIHMAFNGGDRSFYRIPDNATDIRDYYELADQDVIKRIVSPDRREARISFVARAGAVSRAADFSDFVESRVASLCGDDYQCRFTGISSLYVIMEKNLRTGQIRSFSTAFVLIFLMMFVMTGNIRLTLMGMVPNVFPVVVTLGIMGWAGIPLDASTIMTASITIGIAVDNTIHFITWFTRHRKAGLSTEASVAKAFRDTGSAIVMTSVVLCAVFFMLMTGSVLPIVFFGLFSGLSMVFALIGDLVILPAMMMMVKPVLTSK